MALLPSFWSSTVLEGAQQDARFATLDQLGGPTGAPSHVQLRMKQLHVP